MANKKLKLLYLAQYLQEETDERHPKTMQDMIAYLERCGISAERKSLYDDLELLRLYGMDVQSVRGKSYGYFLGDREFQLPELKLLIDVVQASPFLTQGKSMELIAKLEKLTSRPNARQLRRQVYVMDRVRTHNERLYYAVDGLHTAINDDRKVTFRYFDWTASGGKSYRREGALYETNPVALCVDTSWSMVQDGRWVPMKRTALALNHLVATRFRSDALQLVTFGRYASTVDSAELASLEGTWEQGTNLHHALLLAGRHLRRNPDAQPVVLVVTDGEPTAHLDVPTADALLVRLRRELRDRTVIHVTHRWSETAHADLVLRVEGGEITVVRAADGALIPG